MISNLETTASGTSPPSAETKPVPSCSVVHRTALSAAAALFALVASGAQNGSIRVNVSVVGKVIRGLTQAACLHPLIAPVVQQAEQAHADICRRGAALMAQPERTGEEATELETLSNTAKLLDDDIYAENNAPRFVVVDDHPDEDFVTVRVEFPAGAENRNEMDSDMYIADEQVAAVERVSREFVDELIVAHKVCPYTASNAVAGVNAACLTVGDVRYVVNRKIFAAESSCLELTCSTLECAVELMAASESDISTSLLCFAALYRADFALFAQHAEYMTDVVSYCGLKEDVDIVLFHPRYSRNMLDDTREIAGHLPPAPQLAARVVASGKDITDKDVGSAADYARRAPVATINVLRSSHLRALAAENGAGQEMLYVKNANRLANVGTAELQAQVDGWSGRIQRG